jgi:alkanesulfonate monooxygenase SsuD/methylene tetrahydromethanopterin reductase-like flavin-dependent oxidoreductase (luciferase family)
MECDAYGIPLPPLKERFDRFDEGVESMVMLLSQSVSNFSGQYIQLTDARCEPKPIQKPHPPITIGGSGRKRTLRAAGRWAQQWNTLGREGVDGWQELKGVLAAHCANAGRDISEITCSVNIRYEDNLDEAIADATTWRDAGVDLLIVGLPLHCKPEALGPLAEALAPLA